MDLPVAAIDVTLHLVDGTVGLLGRDLIKVAQVAIGIEGRFDTTIDTDAVEIRALGSGIIVGLALERVVGTKCHGVNPTPCAIVGREGVGSRTVSRATNRVDDDMLAFATPFTVVLDVVLGPVVGIM